MKIAAIINYSSYHNPFITRVVEEVKKVSDYTCIVSYDEFFDGVKDKDLIMLNVDSQFILTRQPGQSSRYYHNYARKYAYENLPDKYDYVFFLDSDEVLEGDVVKDWLETIQEGEDYKLSHYWYYRDTCYQANIVEEGAVLVSTETLDSPSMEWFGYREREDFTRNWNYLASLNGRVLGHHYSWAGTKEMLLRKVSSWGHNNDNINWKQIVENEFKYSFNGICPFKPYTFIKVKPYINFTINEDSSSSKLL